MRKGVDLKALSFSVLAGVIIWLLPAPVGVSLKAWHLLAHFVATIVGIITSVRATAWERGGGGSPTLLVGLKRAAGRRRPPLVEPRPPFCALGG